MTRLHLFTGILLFMLSYSLYADGIDKQTARKVAQSFLTERIVSGQISGWDSHELSVSDEYTCAPDGIPAYFVFSNRGNGFIIIAADDRMYPVIGYSTESNFPDLNQNLNFKSYMQSITEQASYVRATGKSAGQVAEHAWNFYVSGVSNSNRSTLQAVPPICKVLWNQDFPYNILCPEDPAGSGGYVYAGCVATAMSMVMYHYRYPLRGTGSHTYYAAGYGAQTADFENTYYRWDEMLNAVSTSDGESVLPVAELQYQAGVAIDMGYSPSGSGASVEVAKNALRANFGYANTIQHLMRTSFTAESWEAMIVKQLDSLLPVIYSGASSGGGHAFLCDGYQETGNGKMFHFNFGWGGSANGYYTLINPAGFGDGQTVVRNIHPKNDYPYYCSNRTITGISGSFEDGSGPRMNYMENTTCTWLLAPADSVTSIQLSFSDFHIHSSDTLFIHDGPDASSPLLAAINGDTLPPEVSSSGNKMFIRLFSDGQNTSKGFQAVYSSNFPVYCNTNTVDTASSGVITDGSGIYRYNNSTYCRWKIMPPGASSIGLVFTDFDLDKKDQVMIFSYGSSAQLLETFTGDSKPYTLISPTGAMMIYFKSDFCGRGKGFRAEYSVSIGKEDDTPFISLMDVYPNPAQEMARLRFHSVSETIYQVVISGFDGKKLQETEYTASAGLNNILLNLAGLQPGMYFITLHNSKGSLSRKFLIR